MEVGVSIETLLSTVNSAAIAEHRYTIRTTPSLTFELLNISRNGKKKTSAPTKPMFTQ